MPVDPYIQMMLQQMAFRPFPSSIQEMRSAEGSSLAAMPIRPVVIGEVRDLTVPGPASQLPARLYQPLGDGPFPLTVFFHGGGFAVGNIASHDSLCRELCVSSGSAVLSVEYRLAPEAPFPAPGDDCYAAYLWAAEHAAELNADPARLAVAGDSAGGNLAIVVTLRCRDEGGPMPKAQLLIYPATDFVTETASRQANSKGYFLTGDMMRMFGEAYISDPTHAAHPHASPLLSAQLHGLPPALVMTAEFDPLRDEGEGYYQALLKAGNRAEYLPGPGMVHGYANMTGFVPAAAALVDQGAAWLKRELA